MSLQKSFLTVFLAILFFALPTRGQTVVFGDEATHFYEFTVATRPVAPPVGWVIVVTDGLTGADCTVGAGASRALCRWTGAVWEPLGGGGGVTGAGTINYLPKFTAATVLGDSLLTDDATTLTYTGTGGIHALGFYSDDPHTSEVDFTVGGSGYNGLTGFTFKEQGPSAIQAAGYNIHHTAWGTEPTAAALELISIPAANISTTSWMYLFGTTPAALFVTKAAGGDPAANNCVKWLAGGGVGDAGAACGGAPSLDQVTGSAAQATANETGTGKEWTYNGVETANLTYPIVFQNTNGSNNTSGALGINTAGAGNKQVPLIINEVTSGGNLAEFWTGGSFTNGVFAAGGGNRAFSFTAPGEGTATSAWAASNFHAGTGNTDTSVVYKGGFDTNSTAGHIVGSGTFRGADETGATGVNGGGAATLRGGDAATSNASGAGGNVTIRTGREYGIVAAHNQNGKLEIIQTFFTTGTATVGSLACVTADLTVATCSSAANNLFAIGIIKAVTGTAVDVQTAGVTTGLAASAAFAAGHFVCADTATDAGKLLDSATVCPVGTGWGVVLHSETTTTPEFLMSRY